jgi:hypothetical protein
MYLTKHEEMMLDGEYGEVIERNFRLLVRLGDIYGADKMLPVSSCQVAGVSYKSIGRPGMEFLEDYAANNAKVKVLTYLNPAGIDLDAWETLGFPEDFAMMQERIMSAFRKMGIMITATCTPYLAGNLPKFSEHIAWSESSAVSFANSILGARTNREGGPSALASAICGVTPNYGLHRRENRVPSVIVNVDADLKYNSDFGALGYYVGRQVKSGIPYFKGIREASIDELKSLGAAMAASGAIALYYIDEITPESSLVDTKGLESITVSNRELADTYEALNTGETPDLVVFGCPHASLHEIQQLATKLAKHKLKVPVWVCTSRVTKALAGSAGLCAKIERAGGTVVADTCMVVAPVEAMGFKTIGVDSGKAANYLPAFCKQAVVFDNIDNLISMSC